MPGKSIAERIYEHPDREELISRLSDNDIPITDIVEWLAAKYDEPETKSLALPARILVDFKKNYLNFYSIMKRDLSIVKDRKISADVVLTEEIRNNSAYKKALAKYANTELDVKKMIGNLCAVIETRFERVFDNISDDPDNMKFDRLIIDYAVALKDIIRETNEIVNKTNIEQVNIQNNINIQSLDLHVNTISDIIREILSLLDYETSIRFVELFNEKMTALKKSGEIEVVPVEKRLADAQALSNSALARLK